jgi:hypothetical protein
VAYLPTSVVASSRRLLWVNLDPARRCHISMHVRFAPKADNQADISLCPLSANSGHRSDYSITDNSPTMGSCGAMPE